MFDPIKTKELGILENAETTDSNSISEISNEEEIIDEVHLVQIKLDELKAKQAELDQWKSREIYEKTEDSRQECISLRWVVRSKRIDNKPGLKARLWDRRFVEEQNYHTDRLTCSREEIRVMFELTSSKKLAINSIDIKSIFSRKRF